MARTAQQRSKRSKSRARRPPGGGQQINVNDTLFFPRLRTHAKWLFVLLAIVFGISFVAFGVGSGSSGLSGIFGSGGLFGLGSSSGGGDSISKLQKAAAKHPRSAQGYRDLATALETKTRIDEAVVALARYTQLKPKDGDSLIELAGLYLRQAQTARQAASAAQSGASPVTGGTIFGPDSASKLGQALSGDPIVNAVGSKANAIVQAQYAKYQAAGAAALATYGRLARLRPRDPSVQLDLEQAAESIGNKVAAIAAFRQYLKLAPNDPSAPAVRQRIKQLLGLK